MAQDKTSISRGNITSVIIYTRSRTRLKFFSKSPSVRFVPTVLLISVSRGSL